MSSKPSAIGLDNLVTDWLIHSYLYYVLDREIITDHEFDTLYRLIEANWDKINHRHKHLLLKDCLKSGFYIKDEDYPSMVKSCAEAMLAGKLTPRRYL